jgi:hypothetical protein
LKTINTKKRGQFIKKYPFVKGFSLYSGKACEKISIIVQLYAIKNMKGRPPFYNMEKKGLD